MTVRDHYAVIATALSERPVTSSRPRSCFVALGDSFTAGTGCKPGESWADRLAAELRAHNPRLLYENLGVDGATSEDVLDQVGRALQLEPDLVSVVCGGNDVLRRRRPDIEGYAERLDAIFCALLELPAVTLLTATAPTQWSFLGMGPRTAKRVDAALSALNETTREIARARGVLCLEVAGHRGLEDPANFSSDGLHPSALGHERTARAFASLLEGTFDPSSDEYGGDQEDAA